MEHNIRVIDAAIRLHNFIVEYKLCSGKRKQNNPEETYDDQSVDFMNENPSKIVGVFGDETRETTKGRLSHMLKELKEDEEFLRNTLYAKIEREGIVCTPTNYYRNVSNCT